MIREYIIVLTDKQEKELAERSKAAGAQCDLQFLQAKIFKWLKPKEDLADTLAKGLEERWTHTEK